MLFNSLQFLIFFPIVVLFYFVLPQRIRYIWLLVASYYFYMCWNAKYALLILFSTAITYISGILIEYIKSKQLDKKSIVIWKKSLVAVCFLLNLGILFFYKYFEFVLNNLGVIFSQLGIELYHPKFDIILPVGISFYTFQALGYIMDVYRDEIYAEKNFFKYALFVSFFPQLVAGPIERSRNLLKQINIPTKFNVEKARYGLLTMAYGLFVKMVIADRISLVINPILLDFNSYNGMVVAMCIVLFAFQIYCDFQGYTQIAIGSAKVLGFDLQENFESPYFAANIKEYWKRWHISLTSWFTDYLYIPLGGNRKGKVRKYINVVIVFLCSGLWHGASWNYVVWGGVNGLYLIIYDFISPIIRRIIKWLRINTEQVGWKITLRIMTFLLVDYSWLYFRAEGLKNAFQIQIKILNDFHLPYLLTDEFLTMFGNYSTLVVLIFSFIFLFITDWLKYKGRDWKEEVFGQQIIYRWLVYMVILFAILIFGIYGVGGDGQTEFIYFQF